MPGRNIFLDPISRRITGVKEAGGAAVTTEPRVGTARPQLISFQSQRSG